MVLHANNPHTQEAETEGLGSGSEEFRETVSQKKKKKSLQIKFQSQTHE
jgi:hypothetical protein